MELQQSRERRKQTRKIWHVFFLNKKRVQYSTEIYSLSHQTFVNTTLKQFLFHAQKKNENKQKNK